MRIHVFLSTYHYLVNKPNKGRNMTLPLYVFGKQTLETFLLAALEGCESKQEVYMVTHPMHQRRILSTCRAATYLVLEVSDHGITDTVKDSTHLLISDTREVLESYESRESTVVKDVIAFVLSNDKAMESWYTKTYGSPVTLNAFVEILRDVLYRGRDFAVLLDRVVRTNLKNVAITWTQKIDDQEMLVIDEISPTKAHAKTIFDSIATVDDVTGLRIYSDGVLRYEMLK